MKNKKEKQPEQVEEAVNPEVEILKAQLARTLADYDNLHKRVERERGDLSRLTTMRFLMRFMPIFDMIEGAQRHLNDAGLGISLKVLADTLKEEGIVEIEAKDGMMFNEELHEAIDAVHDEARQNGEIIEVALKGYAFIEGSVIRHAKVTVNKLT